MKFYYETRPFRKGIGLFQIEELHPGVQHALRIDNSTDSAEVMLARAESLNKREHTHEEAVAKAKDLLNGHIDTWGILRDRAVAQGLQDLSYDTQRYSRVRSYSGIVIFMLTTPRGSMRVRATGYPATGDAQVVHDGGLWFEELPVLNT